MEMMRTMDECKAMEAKLADLLLEPETASEALKAHVAACANCGRELAELRGTMAAMDAWVAPEPSPYFMTRMNARLEEAREAPPAGWLERLRARFTYGPRPLHAKPLVAMAMTVVLLVGGGTYLSITNEDQPAPPPPQAAVVHDLQVIDNNAQLLDQLESLSTSDNSNTN